MLGHVRLITSLESSRLSHGQFQSDLGATSKTWHHRVLEYFCTQKILPFIRQDPCWICNDMTLFECFDYASEIICLLWKRGRHPPWASSSIVTTTRSKILNSTTTLSRLQRHSGNLISYLFGHLYCAISCARQGIPNVQSTSCLITN